TRWRTDPMRRAVPWLLACIVFGSGPAALATVSSEVVTFDNVGVQTLGIFATCPGGTTALGAGIDEEFPSVMSVAAIGPQFASGSFDTMIPGSYPAERRWVGFITNTGNTHPLAVAAICAPGQRTLEIEARPVDAHGIGAARVLCPGDALAVGGGPSVDNDGVVTSSGPVVDDGPPDGARLIDYDNGVAPAPIGWRTTLRDDGTQGLDERAAASCDTSFANLVTRIATTTVPELDTITNRVLCEAGEGALGGGADTTDTTNVVLPPRAPVYEKGPAGGQRPANGGGGTNPAPIGWFASARNE